MEHISCYVDTQGFYYKQKFYPREIAICSKFGTHCFTIDHGIKYDSLSWYERRSVSHCTKNHHGLPFEAKTGLPLKLVPKVLKHMFEAACDSDHFLAGVKSKEAESMLKELEIPRMNLQRYGACWKQFDGNYNPCNLHINPGRCSLNAVICMKKWVQRYLKKISDERREEQNKPQVDENDTDEDQSIPKEKKSKNIWNETRDRWITNGDHRKVIEPIIIDLE